MAFSDDLERYIAETTEKLTKVKRMSAFDLFSSIVIQTPVLEGVLRNNWYANLGSGSTATTTASSSSAATVTSRIQQELTGTDLVKDIYFTNNLPYAYRIEFDGHSAKAPEGMVRINCLRWDTIVRNNARLVGGGS